MKKSRSVVDCIEMEEYDTEGKLVSRYIFYMVYLCGFVLFYFIYLFWIMKIDRDRERVLKHIVLNLIASGIDVELD